MGDFCPFALPSWSFPLPLDCPSPGRMEHVHEDETTNGDVHDALAALEHDQQSPLEEVSFATQVSTLPLAYSSAITAGLNEMWGLDVSASGGSDARLGDPSADTGGAQVTTECEDTRTGECDGDINLQFSQQVRHRESTRTPHVQDAVTKLMRFLADQEIGNGRGVRGVAFEHIKEVMRNYGETCGSAFHPTKHMQRVGQQTYVCGTVWSVVPGHIV
jgi:hypothetical protein